MIDSIKDLEKLLKLCRKQGVTEISVGAVAFKLGDLPSDNRTNQSVNDDLTEYEEIANPFQDFPGGVLTPEHLAHYANGGTPQEDPFSVVPQ